MRTRMRMIMRTRLSMTRPECVRQDLRAFGNSFKTAASLVMKRLVPPQQINSCSYFLKRGKPGKDIKTSKQQLKKGHHIMSSPEIPCTEYAPKTIDSTKDWDIIVIGSGIGGLTVASLMAQTGQKVLVLEQHWTPGGCMRTFESDGYRFATGIHYVGNMHDGGQLKNVLDNITLPGDPVVWDKIQDPIETTILGAPSAKYERAADQETFKQYLIEKFPHEQQGIEQYFQSVKEANIAYDRSFVLKSLPLSVVRSLTWTGLHNLMDGGYSKWASKSLQQVLEEVTDDKELQAVLAGNYSIFGTDPKHAPFVIHAAAVSSYRHGTYYPRGGPSIIATKIMESVTSNNGRVLSSARVKRIILDDDNDKEVKGVEMVDGTIIFAKKVVSDAGLFNTANHLLPPDLMNVDVDEDCSSRYSEANKDHLHPSQTCLSLFVGLAGDAKTLNLPGGGAIFIHPSNDLNGTAETLQKMTLEQALEGESVAETMEGESMHTGPIFVSIPSVHDQAWDKEFPGKSAIEVMAFCPSSWFSKYETAKDKEYQEVKIKLVDKIWKRVVEVLEEDCPGLPKDLENMDHFRIGTPLPFSNFLSRGHGALYGLDHDMKRFHPTMHYLRLRPKVPEVHGLYLTGQDVSSVGFGGAMMGGLLCAANIQDVTDPLSLVRRKGGVEARLACTTMSATEASA